MFKHTKIMTGVLAALGGQLAITALPAAAQGSQVVEVTGSRILRASDLAGTTPVVSVGLQEMGNLGIENFADMANQMPQFAASFGESRSQSTFSGVATSGLNTVNLRNLGSERSLVLINGRRVPGGTSTTTAVDFNNIPTANIDRIEIITGGASAVYGSDAVAGVINVITKKNFEGVEVNASYGKSSEGDNENPSASIVMGGKFGSKGRALITFEYNKQDQISCRDRYICAEDFLWTAPGNPIRGPNAYSGVGLGGRFFIGSTGYTRRNGSFTDSNGALIPFSTPIDGYNRNADRDIAIPTTRILGAADLEYELTAGVRAFGELNYSNTSIDSKFEGHPFQSNQPGSRYGTLNPNIPVNNPFIPQPLRDAINAFNANPANAPMTEMVWWQRFNDAGGPRGADSTREMFRTVVGLKGDLPSIGGFGRDFRWEASHTFGQTRVNLNTEGLVNTANLYHGLRVEADPANPGQFRCVDAGARAQGCVPINPFADYTPEMQQALRIGSMAIGHNSLNDTLLTMSGSLFDLPAGALRAAAGLERRTFSGFLDRDVVVNNALATGNQISDTDYAKTEAKEIFAEVLVPILADKPFARSLNFEGAIRYTNADTSNYNTWNYGGDWEPIGGLRLRAKYAKSVRAPTPDDLSGVGQTFGVVRDPCTEARRTANPTREANCAADGVPANYNPPQTVEQGVGGLTGGNPNLEPEVAKTLTFGLVWLPPEVKGLSVAIDRFDIDVDKIITTVSRQIAVDQCYDTPGRVLCNVVTRGTNIQVPGANYVLTEVNERLENVARQKISGVDFDVRYVTRLPSAWGDLSLGLLATYYDKATLDVPGNTLNLEGQAGGSTTDQGWIKWTANTNANWRWNNFNFNWNLRYVGRAEMALGTTEAGFPEIGAHTYHNIRLGYQVAKTGEIYFGVTNLFDKQPPFFASGTSGTQALDTIPAYYDVYGRSFFLGGKYKF